MHSHIEQSKVHPIYDQISYRNVSGVEFYYSIWGNVDSINDANIISVGGYHTEEMHQDKARLIADIIKKWGPVPGVIVLCEHLPYCYKYKNGNFEIKFNITMIFELIDQLQFPGVKIYSWDCQYTYEYESKKQQIMKEINVETQKKLRNEVEIEYRNKFIIENLKNFEYYLTKGYKIIIEGGRGHFVDYQDCEKKYTKELRNFIKQQGYKHIFIMPDIPAQFKYDKKVFPKIEKYSPKNFFALQPVKNNLTPPAPSTMKIEAKGDEDNISENNNVDKTSENDKRVDIKTFVNNQIGKTLSIKNNADLQKALTPLFEKINKDINTFRASKRIYTWNMELKASYLDNALRKLFDSEMNIKPQVLNTLFTEICVKKITTVEQLYNKFLDYEINKIFPVSIRKAYNWQRTFSFSDTDSSKAVNHFNDAKNNIKIHINAAQTQNPG